MATFIKELLKASNASMLIFFLEASSLIIHFLVLRNREFWCPILKSVSYQAFSFRLKGGINVY